MDRLEQRLAVVQAARDPRAAGQGGGPVPWLATSLLAVALAAWVVARLARRRRRTPPDRPTAITDEELDELLVIDVARDRETVETR